jgi:hypothetical protein
MKFFTAILSALALAVSTTSATPIDGLQNVTFPLNIMYPATNVTWVVGSQYPILWDTTENPVDVLDNTGTLFLAYTEGLGGPSFFKSKLFSLPPPPRAPVGFPPVADLGKLNLYATSPFRSTACGKRFSGGWQLHGHRTVYAIRNILLCRS